MLLVKVLGVCMKRIDRKWFDWLSVKKWIEMDEVDGNYEDEEIRQSYIDLYNSFSKKRNAYESQTFNKVKQFNQHFSDLCNHTKRYISLEDAGTAGDIVEEELVIFLNKIFPSFKIKTKGKIIDEKGNQSPQIDILVLDKDYPSELLSETVVSADSVLLAIECKLTLRKEGLIKSIETAKFLKNLNGKYTNNLLTKQIKYGVFALSNEVKKSGKKTDEAVIEILEENSLPNKPLQLIDFVCVPNDYCVYLDLYACDDPNLENPEFLYYIGQFDSHALNYPYEYPNLDPLGIFIYKTVKLLTRLTNSESNWNESSFGMFDTVGSSQSDLFYQRLSDIEVNSVVSRQVNEKTSKVFLSFGRGYKERYKLN